MSSLRPDTELLSVTDDARYKTEKKVLVSYILIQPAASDAPFPLFTIGTGHFGPAFVNLYNNFCVIHNILIIKRNR